MTIEKLDCTRCGTQILPATAAKNGGLCKPCKLGNKPIAPKTTIGKVARTYSVAKEFATGVALTIAGGGLAAFFTYNLFTGVLSNSWFFRYIYSPIFSLLCLLFALAGIALVVSAFKKMNGKA